MLASRNNSISGKEMKMSEILEKIGNNEYVHHENPFNNPNFKRNEFKGDEVDTDDISSTTVNKKMEMKIRSDMENFHKTIKQAVNDYDDKLISLSNKLISAVLTENMDEIYELTILPNFKDFVDIKDTSGFNAVEYAVNYGKNNIVGILIRNGASEDNLDLSSFINIPSENDQDEGQPDNNSYVVNVPIYDSQTPEHWRDLPMDDIDKVRSLSDEIENTSSRIKIHSFKSKWNDEEETSSRKFKLIHISNVPIYLDDQNDEDEEQKYLPVENESTYDRMIEEKINNSKKVVADASYSFFGGSKTNFEEFSGLSGHKLSELSTKGLFNLGDSGSIGSMENTRQIAGSLGEQFIGEEIPKSTGVKIDRIQLKQEGPLLTKKQTDKIISGIKPLGRLEKIKEEASKFVKSTETKKSGGLSFTNVFKKNFIKNGFSEERESDRIKVPKGKETSVEEMEEILKKSGISLNKTGTYAAINNVFLEKYSKRDITKLLIPVDKINPVLLQHRIKMLPGEPNKENLHQMVMNLLRQQIPTVTNDEINGASGLIYEYMLFYRDFFLRLIEIDKITIKNSPIHGKGVFAIKDIKEGSLITFYFPYFLEYVHPDVLNEKNEGYVIVPISSRRKITNNNGELDYLRKGTIRISDHFMLVGDDQYISDYRICGHMINDPCDFSKGKVTEDEYEKQIISKANGSVVSYEKDRRFIYVAATRDIKEGEEILVPYSARYWEL